MFLKKYKLYPVILFSLFSFPQLMHAQTDSLFLTVDQLFERGVQYSLQLQADAMKESMAQERTRTARTARLPELQIGLKGGFVGQPVVWERGLSVHQYAHSLDIWFPGSFCFQMGMGYVESCSGFLSANFTIISHVPHLLALP